MATAPDVCAQREWLPEEPPFSYSLAATPRLGAPGPGDILQGKYQLLGEIGRGGMGAVYEGEHVGTGRRVAVKLLSRRALADRGAALERFRREACAAARIESRHVVQVFDMGTEPRWDAPYLVMELLHGLSLDDLLLHAGRVTANVAMAIAGQACRGLARAHAAGIVHRDIKPANLFLADGDDGESVVKLLDFGVAKVKPSPAVFGSWEEITGAGQVVGSPLYMSPEQALGLSTLDHRSDLWSLGTVLYEMLSGRTPHTQPGTNRQIMTAICSTPAPPIQYVAPWVPEGLAAVITRALAVDPDARFRDAAEMLDALRATARGDLTLRTAALAAGEARFRLFPRGGDATATTLPG